MGYGYDDFRPRRRPPSKTKRKLDLATRLLCALCRAIELRQDRPLIESVENGELKTWWDENKKRDARREAREAAARQRVAAKKAATQRKEALRKSGLAKLNDAEKEALGIKTSKKKR